MLPTKRKPVRSGIERAPRRIYSRHRKHVRSYQCVVSDCETHGNPFALIEFCHLSVGLPPEDAQAKGQKSHDCWGWSGCDAHHEEQHRIGQWTFMRKYKLDLHQKAVEFAQASPCPEIRAKVPEMRAWVGQGAWKGAGR